MTGIKKRIFLYLILLSVLPCYCAYSFETDTGNVLNYYVRYVKEHLNWYSGSVSENIDIDLPAKVNSLTLENFVNNLRGKGLFLGFWNVNVGKIDKIPFPFMAYLKKYGWGVLKNKDKVSFIFDNGGRTFVIQKEDFAKEEIFVIAPYVCSIWLDKFCILDKSKGKIFIIYSYHDDDFNLIKERVEELKTLANRKGKELFYIDELGLIPLDTVNSYMKRYNVPEKGAFKKIKSILLKDVKRLEQGVPIYDSLNTYYQIYKYLAKNRVKSTMEDLGYMNWRKIVLLDHLYGPEAGAGSFIGGDVDLYVELIKLYNRKYWIYNIKERDENLVRQISNIVSDHPNSMIFTIRGIGHVGLEEKLIKAGIDSSFVVLGKGVLREVITNGEYVQIANSIGVSIDENKYYLYSLVQEYLRNYICNFRKVNSRNATVEANRLIRLLKPDDIYELSKALSEKFRSSDKKLVKDNIFEFIYNWVQNRVKKQSFN